MKNIRYILLILLIPCLIWITGCGPKSVTTEPEDLQDLSREWIPYSGNESVTYVYDTNEMIFSGQGRETYYENIRYMTDQSGFFTLQEDYYANLEREELVFESPSSDYFISYKLERDKGDTGDWDILRITLADGFYYSNHLKIVVFETDNFDKGEVFKFSKSSTLNGVKYDSVYYWKQERRPFEIYYTKKQGVIGFKLTPKEIWTLKSEPEDK
ncbi:MAG: hypothetical protein JW731_14810 [Bacteroidales bacterium]|nr:hypothetical protein [Bacteroidales bacterium]